MISLGSTEWNRVCICKIFSPKGIIEKLYPDSNEVLFLLISYEFSYSYICCCSITLLLDAHEYNNKLQDTNVSSFFHEKSFAAFNQNPRWGVKLLINSYWFCIHNMYAFKIKGKLNSYHQKSIFSKYFVFSSTIHTKS